MDKDVVIEVVSGVEGHCVTLNNYRVAGQKPWGGGHVVHSFQTKQSQIDCALRRKPENEPLTLDELLQFNMKEPIWDDCLHSWCAVRGEQIAYFGGGNRPLQAGRFYRRKPERSEG